MTVLAHISDLHFGAADPAATQDLKAALNELAPDLVVVSGDLTQSGRRREFIEASQFLQSLDAEKLVIPGNHDVSVWNPVSRFLTPWGRFSKTVNAELDPVFAQEGLCVMGLNSARRAGPYADWSRGRLSRRQLHRVQDVMMPARADFKAIALHHPIEIAGGKAGANAVYRAAEAIAVFSRVKTDLVLTGHVHQSAASLLQPTQSQKEPLQTGPLQEDSLQEDPWQFVMSKAGTATSIRTRGEAASINLIDHADNAMTIQILHHTSTGFLKTSQSDFLKAQTGWQRA